MKDLKVLRDEIRYFEATRDIIDSGIDLLLNLRQSGHPGGSRSKVPAMVAATLSGAIRFDHRDASKRFGDRFVLIAGHCTPLLYSTLAVYSEALAEKFRRTGDARYAIAGGDARCVRFADLLTFRRRHGLPGHAEMEGKTLFVKANTGPSGHGAPMAAGEALALKLAGAGDVRVFAMEGEGGLTTGVTHEVKNSSWGLGLGNLIYLLDWNNFGIDDPSNSSVVNGNPESWFRPYGWRVAGAAHGENFEQLFDALHAIAGAQDANVPGIVWFKMRKGRGYGKYDNHSHGSPHKTHSKEFWGTRAPFQEKYGVKFEAFGEAPPADAATLRKQTESHFETVRNVLCSVPGLVDFIADRLVEIGDSVPMSRPDVKVIGNKTAETAIPELFIPEKLPALLFEKPGSKVPNRQALAKMGAWINTLANERLGRPLVIAASADLAESTSIHGFMKGTGDFAGFGRYERFENLNGALLPQQITEFANSGIVCGLASVNFADDPEKEFSGFWGACSTYGSFSYLKYGPMRLFSQLAQDCQLKVGRVIWIAGHSGPETAEDSRTHFGIFAPAVTQLFPDGHCINIHPWEYNEVAPALSAALATGAPIIALHLTRPAVTVPDREALGCDSYLYAARGAYIAKDFDKNKPKAGTIIVQGTSTCDSIFKLIPELKEKGPNVKIVIAVSPELFRRQDESYRNRVLPFDDWMDSTIVSSMGRRTMHDWLSTKVAEEYAMTSDFDNRWRTGGSVDEVIDEAHLSPDWLRKGIARFAAERDKRLSKLRSAIPG
ncbi:MAG: transketolase [Planctomycetes bacterium]|nr:transketolase [Planctomycetota bacterium]